MSQDIPGVFVIDDGAGNEKVTLTHDGEHLALRTFPFGEVGNPVMLDLAEAEALAQMLMSPWPVITVTPAGEFSADPEDGPLLPKIRGPFTAGQVASLVAYQADGTVHEFTCRNDSCPREQEILEAEASGWTCAACSYRQNWAFEFMTDWSWRRGRP